MPHSLRWRSGRSSAESRHGSRSCSLLMMGKDQTRSTLTKDVHTCSITNVVTASFGGQHRSSNEPVASNISTPQSRFRSQSKLHSPNSLRHRPRRDRDRRSGKRKFDRISLDLMPHEEGVK